jgi:hypothetical protein
MQSGHSGTFCPECSRTSEEPVIQDAREKLERYDCEISSVDTVPPRASYSPGTTVLFTDCAREYSKYCIVAVRREPLLYLRAFHMDVPTTRQAYWRVSFVTGRRSAASGTISRPLDLDWPR